MDRKELRTLKIIQELDKEHQPSQRDLARTLGLSLGLVNSFLKRLVNKGYFKVSTIPRNRVRFILTPEGATEKTRLTYEYIKRSYGFYKEARQRLRELFGDLEKDGARRVAIYGATDLAEVAYLSLRETSLGFDGILDDFKIGEKFINFIVRDPDDFKIIDFDRVFIAAIESKDVIFNKLAQKGVSEHKILTLDGKY